MFKTLAKKLIYENRWVRLWQDDVILPSGEKTIYSYIERPDQGSMIVPMLADGRFILLREWRYPVQGWTWCWPAGGSNDPAEDKLLVAQRELEEETGYTATDWVDLGGLAIDPGLSNQYEHIFLA